MNSTKLNIHKKVLQEACGKINGAEQYIKERIGELCSGGKLSVEEVTSLFMDNCDNF